ncbi:hypothetical protein KUV50_07785 [Membranicola marinus]|uniref:Uncharacterized protein n=1 Tax=Membranihabitans marinus TaxID=1227546 RepID=A0A953HTA6_9BACT|nr:hypothetical protein [Membranihabitans marinus]MBY5958025.1 hypothetical protein [Membranihabitans marinus]
MKLFKHIAIVLLLITSIHQISTTKPLEDPNAKLRSVVVKLLKNPTLQTTLDQSVRISFFITTDDELVVLKTDARSNKLDEFIKERMNYHKINVKDLEVNRIIHIKVQFRLNSKS